MRDVRGYLNGFIYHFLSKTISALTTIFCRYAFTVKGVDYGKDLKFFGLSRASRCFGSKIRIGNNCRFRSGYFFNRMGINKKCHLVTLRQNAEIILGNNVGLSGAVITSAKKVTIGDSVLLGAESFITDYDWHGIDPARRNEAEEPKEVVIEDNVWLGYRVIVLKGVTIGKNSVIGANSVVTKNIPENVIAAGNPCKVIRSL